MCGHLLEVDFVWQGRWKTVFAESVGEDFLGVIAAVMVVLPAFCCGGQMTFADLLEFDAGWTWFVLAVTVADCGLLTESSVLEGVEGCNGGKY